MTEERNQLLTVVKDSGCWPEYWDRRQTSNEALQAFISVHVKCMDLREETGSHVCHAPEDARNPEKYGTIVKKSYEAYVYSDEYQQELYSTPLDNAQQSEQQATSFLQGAKNLFSKATTVTKKHLPSQNARAQLAITSSTSAMDIDDSQDRTFVDANESDQVQNTSVEVVGDAQQQRDRENLEKVKQGFEKIAQNENEKDNPTGMKTRSQAQKEKNKKSSDQANAESPSKIDKEKLAAFWTNENRKEREEVNAKQKQTPVVRTDRRSTLLPSSEKDNFAKSLDGKFSVPSVPSKIIF